MNYTIIDVAKKAGVSKSTVSRVISGKGYISREAQEKVMKAIEELQYKPNRVARAMVSQQTNTIGVIIYREHHPIASHPFYGKILDAILMEAEKLNYSVFVTTDKEMSLKSADFMLERRVDGLILMSRLSYEVIDYIDRSKIPYLIVNGTIEKDGVIQLFNSDKIGGGIVAEHLNQLGHRKIIAIAGPQHHRSHFLRIEGFCEQLNKLGEKIFKEDIYEAFSSTFSAGYQTLQQHWGKISAKKPTAIFATNDMLAIGAMKFLLEKGIKIPGDLSVIGFDNIDYSRIFHPPLTTVEVDKTQMGKDAVTLLGQLIKDGSVKNIRKIKVEYDSKLIVRNSTNKK